MDGRREGVIRQQQCPSKTPGHSPLEPVNSSSKRGFVGVLKVMDAGVEILF